MCDLYHLISQENDLKRARALKKTEGEREACREKDTEIDRLRSEIREKSQVVEGQKRAIMKLVVFRRFMTAVREMSHGEVSHFFDMYILVHFAILCDFLVHSLVKLGRLLQDTTLSARPERYIHNNTASSLFTSLFLSQDLLEREQMNQDAVEEERATLMKLKEVYIHTHTHTRSPNADFLNLFRRRTI